MAAVHASFRRIALLLAVVIVGAFGLLGPARSALAAMPSTSSKALTAPKTTYEQDASYLSDVAEADPSLASYEQKQGNVALRALLTDGSAFCALTARGGGLDKALVEEVTGVRGTESQTHLPLSVTTFNTIEAVSLLRLCPGEQKLVPASVRTKIHRLAGQFAKRTT